MKEQQNNYILLQGIFLISVLFFSLLVSSLLFMLHISISSVNLLLAILCSVAVTFYFSDKSIKKTAITAAVGLVIISACVFLCMHVYDWSWDGNAYRKARTGLLKYGWNPLYETFFDFAAANLPDIDTQRLWFDRSPAASEIIGANFYAVTNNIEAGKCYTILSAIALLCICYAFLDATNKLQRWQIVCCSLFVVLNPVVLAQCVTNYNDAFLGILLLLCAISLLYLTFFENQRYDLLSWYFIFISISIGFNIKISMGLFLAILCLSICLYWFVAKYHEIGLYKTILHYRKHFCLFCVSVFSGLFVTGSTYYLRNIIFFGSPFGGFTTSSGGTLASEITTQMPVAYKELSNFARFFCSIFSRSNSSRTIESIEFKFPLMFDADEIASAQRVDIRTAGWGIFFSGIFLISLFVLFMYLFKKNNVSVKLKHVTIIWLSAFLISLFFIPGLSWARYNIVPFWLPVAALIYIFIDLNKCSLGNQFLSFLVAVIVLLLLLNMSPNIKKNYDLIKEYNFTYESLLDFKSVTESSDVVIGMGQYGFYGRFFNLYDLGINNFTRGDVDTANCTGNLFGDFGLYYDVKSGITVTENFKDFFSYLTDMTEFSIFIAVKDEASNGLAEEVVDNMQKLGLDFDLRGHYRWGYLAVLNDQEVLYEKMSDEKIEYSFYVGDHIVEMQSAGYEKGNRASIKIDEVEYAINKRGLNIVVYDKRAGQVIDSVSIDTYKDNSLSRK